MFAAGALLSAPAFGQAPGGTLDSGGGVGSSINTSIGAVPGSVPAVLGARRQGTFTLRGVQAGARTSANADASGNGPLFRQPDLEVEATAKQATGSENAATR